MYERMMVASIMADSTLSHSMIKLKGGMGKDKMCRSET